LLDCWSKRNYASYTVSHQSAALAHMEVSALKYNGLPGLRGPTPLLRLQSDERLIGLIRRGHHSAFETLVSRYEARLLAFCRHMLASREDAEDVLQEVFAAAFNAILADQREINVRPWLYRIARNRSLNHLRRTTSVGVDSMDIHFADQGQSTGDQVFKREAFRQLIGDVQQLPETQRTALLLREIDALSYEQIAAAMETTVPSVKSLLVRARISLAEAAQARQLSCQEVRGELGEVAEGLAKMSAPVRRHLRSCERCASFRSALKANNQVMAAVFPVGVVLLFKKLVLTKLGSTASAGGAHVAGAGAAAGAAGATGAGGGVGLMTAGASALATKAVAGLAAAALVTAGAVEVNTYRAPRHRHLGSAAVPTRSVPLLTHSRAQAFSAARAPTPLRRHARPASARRTASKRPAHVKGRPAHVRARPVRATVPRASVKKPTLKAGGPRAGKLVPIRRPAPRPPVTQTQTDTTVLPAQRPAQAAPPPAQTTPPPSSGAPAPSGGPPPSSSPVTGRSGASSAQGSGPGPSGGTAAGPPPPGASPFIAAGSPPPS